MKKICIIGNNLISLYNALKYNDTNIEIHMDVQIRQNLRALQAQPL